MIIAALSTPVGKGALNVIRLSGAGCKALAQKMFAPFPEAPNYLRLGKLSTALFEDAAMCVYFDAPKSFTGEESVEFHCHGGKAVSEAVLEKCFSLGARPALNGEFSKRAFVNGKQNLSNAEGTIDLIEAESSGAARAGAMLMENKLGRLTEELEDSLSDVLAGIEAALDYPEEELEGQTVAEQSVAISKVKRSADALLKTVGLGGIIKNGANVVLVGATNAGKSSLLNALAGDDRAIVSDIHGTTRDTVEVPVTYKGLKFILTDTAGLRETGDIIEKKGIERALSAARRASVVLYLWEGLPDANAKASGHAALNVVCPIIDVYTKADEIDYGLSFDDVGGIAVSAKTGYHISELMEKIYSLFDDKTETGFVITNLRHADCLRRASDALASAQNALLCGLTLDCAAADVKAARSALGEITGRSAAEDIIDRIFSRFCLGK